MTTSTTPVFIANCLYCGRFMSWPYPPVGLEWHHECEAIELRREFERDALLEWHHECEAIELRREFERDAL